MRLADSFAIYSVVASPPRWSTIRFDPRIYSELENAASTVAGTLPVLTTLPSNRLPDLGSLERPSRQHLENNATLRPCENLPWFLINAARYSKHCILGQNSVLDSLLIVLQRPWCILELCCCNTPTIVAVQAFVTVAIKFDYVTYSPASRILAHEILQRKQRHCHDFGSVYLRSTPQHRRISSSSCPDVFLIYKELSWSCLQSHNPFWVGLICTCAVWLGVSFSDLTLILGGMFPEASPTNTEGPSDIGAENDTGFDRTEVFTCSSMQLCDFRRKTHRARRSSFDVVSLSKFCWQVQKNWNILHRLYVSADGSLIRYLLDLYIKILRVTREAIP